MLEAVSEAGTSICEVNIHSDKNISLPPPQGRFCVFNSRFHRNPGALWHLDYGIYWAFHLRLYNLLLIKVHLFLLCLSSLPITLQQNKAKIITIYLKRAALEVPARGGRRVWSLRDDTWQPPLRRRCSWREQPLWILEVGLFMSRREPASSGAPY